MALTEARRAVLLAYCKLQELGADPEVLSLLEGFYAAAVAYMEQAGVAEPGEGSGRRALYDLCVNHLVLDQWDRREITFPGTVVTDNPAFRRILVQLKLTEPQEDVSDLDTPEG